MRATLERTVQGLRSQTMTFSNDGIELSLNVPDSSDVKAAFGTMVETVVEQNDEIGRLNNHIETVEKNNRAARKKLIDATSSRLQQLMEHQLKLESQLRAAHAEIKNFTYNIQGYVDENDEIVPPEAASKDFLMSNIAINPAELGDDDGSVRTATLYPTEHGASVESLGFRTVSEAPRPKAKKKDLSAVIYYKSIPKKAMPNDARGRWRWAYKKVMQMIHLKQNKIGLSRTRVEKSQTLMERIQKMDADLFAMPAIIENRVKNSMEKLLGEVGEKIEAIENHIKDIDEKNKERDAMVFNKFQTLETLVQNIDKKVSASLTALEEKQTKMESNLLTSLNELRNQVKDAVALDLDRLRLGLQGITEELGSLDKVVNSSLTDLKALILEDSDIQKMAAQTALDQVVENNAAIQQFRSTVAVAEASCDILQRTIQALKRDVNAAHHHYSQRFLGNHTIVSRDETARLEEVLMRSKAADGYMKVVRDTLSVMKSLLKKHDRDLSRLSQAVNGQAIEATRSFPDIKAGLEELQSRAQSTQTRLHEAQEELQKVHRDVDELKQHDELLMKRLDEDTRSQSLNPDIYKEMSTLKIQMDAVRTLLFDKSRPGSSNVGEAAVAAAMAAAGTAAIAPNPLPTEGFGDLIPKDLRGPMQFTDEDSHHPETHSRPPSGHPTAENADAARSAMASLGFAGPQAGAEGGGSRAAMGLNPSQLTAAVADILRQLLPDLAPALAHAPTLGQGSGIAGHQGLTHPAEEHEQAMESPSELARRRIAERQRPKVEKTTTSDSHGMHGPGIHPEGSEASTGHMDHPGGPISISSAIRQVQQVFGSASSDNLGAAKPGSAPGMAAVNPGVKVAIRGAKMGSMDLSASASAHSSPKVARSRMGGLRGSFESMGGAGPGSRVGSFMVGEYAAPAFDPTPLLNEIASLRAEVINTRRKMELMDEEKVTKSLVEKLCNEALNEQRRRDARTDYRSMIEDADKSIRDLVQEVIYLKRNQESSSHLMREELNKALEDTVQSALMTVTDSLKESVVSTKGLCLGCGRQTAVRTEPLRPASPPAFFPQLSAGSLPGPDVLRGGFKMPVRASSPPPPSLAPLQSPPPGEKDIPLLMRGKVQFDPKLGRPAGSTELLPDVSQLVTSTVTTAATDSDYFDENEPSVPYPVQRDPADRGRPTSNDSRSRSGNSTPGEGLRPIFRKGFPARKSMRAEMNFAPERFELQSLTMPGRPNSRATALPLASQSLPSFAPSQAD